MLRLPITLPPPVSVSSAIVFALRLTPVGAVFTVSSAVTISMRGVVPLPSLPEYGTRTRLRPSVSAFIAPSTAFSARPQPRRLAAAADTIAAAGEVPEIVVVPPPVCSVGTLLPGAATSTQPPKLLLPSRVSGLHSCALQLVALTTINRDLLTTTSLAGKRRILIRKLSLAVLLQLPGHQAPSLLLLPAELTTILPVPETIAVLIAAHSPGTPPAGLVLFRLTLTIEPATAAASMKPWIRPASVLTLTNTERMFASCAIPATSSALSACAAMMPAICVPCPVPSVLAPPASTAPGAKSACAASTPSSITITVTPPPVAPVSQASSA